MATKDVELQVGDVGTAIVILVTENDEVLDISEATDMSFIFKKPNGTPVTKVAAFETDGTDGALVYYIEDDDFLTEGRWQVQAVLTIGDWTGRTEKTTFKVNQAL